MPWLIGVAVLAAALIAVGTWAWISRQHARTTLNAVATQAELGPLEGRLTEARRELSQTRYVNDASKAKEAFARIAVDAQKKQPIYDWARLQEGLAALVAGERPRAKQAFQDIESTGENGFSKEDADLGRFFVGTAKTLNAPGPTASSAQASPT